MRRVLIMVLCLICILTCWLVFPVSAAESGSCGASATWTLTDDGVLTISGSGAIRDYIYSGYGETNPWRNSTIKVKRIVIGSGITSIGDNAFCHLGHVTSVSIPGTVTNIGQAAFYGDSKLSGLTIPSSVTTIEKSAFEECDSLTSVTIPSSVTYLSGSVFEGCSSLSSVTLPSSITTIDASTFAYCSNLTSITIPSGVTSIENFAFGYSALTSITLPGSLKKIAPNAFYSTKLTQVTIPAGVTHLMQDAFGNCYSLKRIQFTGNAPAFDSHVFNCITASAYYPRSNSTWTEAVRQNYGGEITWLAYCGSQHSWGQWTVERETSCDKAGLKVRACTQCDMKEEESIAKVEHQYESTVTPPTCKDNGYTTHTCKVCKTSYKDSTTPAGTHAFGEWVVVKEATCLEKGSKERGCIACDTKETEETDLAAHTYSDTVTPPTCTEGGYTTHVCTLCNDTIVDTPTEKTAHPFSPWQETKAATWFTEGEQQRTCTTCPETETEILARIPINWALVITVVVLLTAATVTTVVLVKKKKKA
ncbi:MAG: leucine-rich repeat protein [Oscillospiraceae bacterium]|nr:leucine-rich repeat protein [Oscillospiraceae bacterium]